MRELTPNEKSILELLKKGKPNKIIAYERNLCESTIKVHVRNIFVKLGVTNRAELIAKVYERDLQRYEFMRDNKFVDEINSDDWNGLAVLTGPAFEEVLDKVMDRLQAY